MATLGGQKATHLKPVVTMLSPAGSYELQGGDDTWHPWLSADPPTSPPVASRIFPPASPPKPFLLICPALLCSCCRNLNSMIYRGTLPFESIKPLCAGLKAGRTVLLTAVKKKLRETVKVRAAANACIPPALAPAPACCSCCDGCLLTHERHTSRQAGSACHPYGMAT